MAIKMQIRRGTATAWATADPILVAGELGFVTDVGKTAFKIGDGTNPWTTLPYVNATYPELPVDAGLNLDNSYVQGRYALLTGVTYTSVPADFTGGTTTQGNSLLLVTVPTNTIVIQELTTSLTPCKRWIRARGASVWTAWKRIDTLSATESLSITNLTLSGKLIVSGGTDGVPSLTFATDTATGIYQSNANQINFTTGGTNRLSIGTTQVASNITITAPGVQAASSGITSAGGISVSNGSTALLATSVDGLLRVSPNTAANKLAVGGTRTATLGLTEIYINASPYLRVYPSTGAAASDLVWTGGNAAGTATTTIRCDGVPTADTDLTTKTYVDTAVSAVTFREMMIIAVDNSDTNYIVGGTVVTGVVNNSLSIRIISSGAAAPGVTYASNLASSTVTWTTGVPSGTRRCLFPSAGTWSVACGVGVNGAGLSFTAIRTA